MTGVTGWAGARGVELVRVDFRKYDGSAHRGYPAVRLGEDKHGTWLGVPGVDFIEAFGAADFKYADPYVLLVPEGTWWTAMFNAPPRRTEIYCDVTTPAEWSGDRVRLVDLDLDVRRRRDETSAELLDEDEFAEHTLRYGYPPDVVREARAAASHLVTALNDGLQPFAGDYQAWLDRMGGGFETRQSGHLAG